MVIFLLLAIVALICFGVSLYESCHCIPREVEANQAIAIIFLVIAFLSFCYWATRLI